MPPLGKLPSLEKLYIAQMKSVKIVGSEFLGVESDHHGSSSLVIAFLKLKSLTIWFLEELEEWDYGITIMGNTFISIMPRLSFLNINGCRRLKALPDHFHQTTTLEELEIVERYREEEGEDWPKISHIPNTFIS